MDGNLLRIPYRIPSGPGEDFLFVLARVVFIVDGVMTETSSCFGKDDGSTLGNHLRLFLSIVTLLE